MEAGVERERETLRQRPLQVFLITYKKMQKLLIHRQWSLLLQCIWKQMVFLMKCRPDQTRTEMTEEEEKTGKTIIKFPKKKWKKNDGKLGTRWKTYRLISNLTRGWNWCLECIRSPPTNNFRLSSLLRYFVANSFNRWLIHKYESVMELNTKSMVPLRFTARGRRKDHVASGFKVSKVQEKGEW